MASKGLIGSFLLLVCGLLIGLYLKVINPLDDSRTCNEFFQKFDAKSAEEWCVGGNYFTWKSSLPRNKNFGELNIFYRTFGSRDNPAILMIHGFPTSSYDFKDLVTLLEDKFFVMVIDTPGYGFSDKPIGFQYSLFDDTEIVDHFLRKIVQIDNFALLTHDKGDTVGFSLLELYQTRMAEGTDRYYEITHHFFMNGGIYLPLAALTIGQKLGETAVIGNVVSRLIHPKMLARTVSKNLFIKKLPDDEKRGLEAIFTYQGGVNVIHDTIQYLGERRVHEVRWLETLTKSEIPTTLIWAELDPVSLVRIADFVWENYLKPREGTMYWKIPCASHFLTVDQPGIITQLVTNALLGSELDFSKFDCSPYVVEK